jgi:hypothetical protein
MTNPNPVAPLGAALRRAWELSGRPDPFNNAATDLGEARRAELWEAFGLVADAVLAARATSTPAGRPCPYCQNIDGHSFDCPRPRATSTPAGLREALDALLKTPAPHCNECPNRSDADEATYRERLSAVMALVEARAALQGADR